MACRDEGQSAAQAVIDRKEPQEKIDKLTRMLCAVLTKFSLARMTDPEVAEWWQDHLMRDRLRLEREARDHAEIERAKNARIAALEAELAQLKSSS